MVFLDLPHPLRPRYHHLALLHQEDSEPEAAGRIFQGCRLRRNRSYCRLRRSVVFGSHLGWHDLRVEQSHHYLLARRGIRSHPGLHPL